MVANAQGWVKVAAVAGEHRYNEGYPACAWQLPQQLDENGRCRACAQAVEQQNAQPSN